MTEAEALPRGRRSLQDICRWHLKSLEHFESNKSFRLHTGEQELVGAGLRHLTSTATCLESLKTSPGYDNTSHFEWFANQALSRDDWTSEGSGAIYCRCRALPLTIQFADKDSPKLREHFGTVLGQISDPKRFAIGEADPDEDQTTWYPPNAFHTFWTVQALTKYEQRFPTGYKRIESKYHLGTVKQQILLWAWSKLSSQVALHQATSSALDTDQLAWSLATITRFQVDERFTVGERDLIAAAVDCVFGTQEESGGWRHYEPIFHYREAGNAYCYMFETMAVLLNNTLQPTSTSLRQHFRRHLGGLLGLLEYVESTKISLVDVGQAIGWCSGHRGNMPYPESWATACVFACLQFLRRLVGVWTRSESLSRLNRVVYEETRDEGIALIRERGDTWSDSESVSEQLMTRIVNPVRMRGRSGTTLEPDDKAISERQMRSAILFGPPGTGKTSLAKGVAAAIGWNYVELHASHFVADGLPNVQRTANAIFNNLMELDRTVVLFDEIDELVRDRGESDAFGRFLTTSMLPKVAELWKQRKAIYFVATNHLGYFDDAIIRTQRFDSLMFVAPPSFDTKIDRLRSLLKQLAPDRKFEFTVKRKDIQKALDGISELQNEDSGDELKGQHTAAKFALLRWDQLDEVASALFTQMKDEVLVTLEVLSRALGDVKDPRLTRTKTYRSFLNDARRSLHDFGLETVWRCEAAGKEFPVFVQEREGGLWCRGEKEELKLRAPVGTELSFRETGIVRLISARSQKK